MSSSHDKNKLYSLKPYNTMGVASWCPEFETVSSEETLLPIIEKIKFPYFVLGGGSNILLPEMFEKSILHNTIKGIEIVDEKSDELTVEVGAGEVWHDFVRWAVNNEYYGAENLSLIPGTVGAAPVQNIGAYGVEVKDFLTSVKYCDLETGKWHWIDTEDCAFGYRDSIFKNSLKGKTFISRIRVKLSRYPQFNLEYGPLKELEGQKGLTAKIVSDAVIAIRQSKLPDPAVLGNTGSFFQNPVVEKSFAKAIKEKYPTMPSYPIDSHHVKIPAAWLIEQAGFKGKRYGDVGCYEKHALVIVNYGEASSEDIRQHVNRVQKGVESRFRIFLHPEVNIL